MPNVQDYLEPTQAAAINTLGAGQAGMAPASPMQPGFNEGNPVARLLGDAWDLIIQRNADPGDAAAVMQFLMLVQSLDLPQGQTPLGQGQGMAAAASLPQVPGGPVGPSLPAGGGGRQPAVPLPLPRSS